MTGQQAPQPPQAPAEFYERATAVLDHQEAAAEASAMLGDDAEVAQSLQRFLTTKLDLEGRTIDGGRIADEDRSGGVEGLDARRAHIDSLSLTAEGTLSPQGRDIVDGYRQNTREIMTDVVFKKDTDWLRTKYGEERAEQQIAKYKKLARDYLARD